MNVCAEGSLRKLSLSGMNSGQRDVGWHSYSKSERREVARDENSRIPERIHEENSSRGGLHAGLRRMEPANDDDDSKHALHIACLIFNSMLPLGTLHARYRLAPSCNSSCVTLHFSPKAALMRMTAVLTLIPKSEFFHLVIAKTVHRLQWRHTSASARSTSHNGLPSGPLPR